MIVQRRDDKQLLITQPDHAALAAKIMRAWRRDGLMESGRRAEILIAVEEHDAGWRGPDESLLVNPATGAIRDFVSAPDEVRQGVWPKSVARLVGTPYAAALVAQHALHIYRRYREEESWQAFFATMESLREHYLEAAGLRSRDDLRRDYLFVRLGDLASLTFCNGWTEPQHDDSGSGYGIRLEGARLVIHPDPFDGRSIPFDIRAREIPAAPLLRDEDARAAWDDAASVTLNGVASGA